MTFAHPGWFALLILLPLLGVGAVLASRLRGRQWNVFVAQRLRGSLLKTSSPLPRWLSLAALLVACAALIGTLTRPQGDAGVKTEKTMGRNVLVALDLSRSMRVRDVTPDRLAQAKIIIYEMLDAMPNDRIGLIGFAGNAYVYAPLTIDHAALRETVEQIDETWATVGGSDLSSAVRLGIQTLKETGQKNNALIIISDGEENKGKVDSLIEDATNANVHIFAVGVGTEDGGFVPHPEYPNEQFLDRSGKPVLSSLRADTLRELSERSGGKYAAAGSGVDVTAMVRSAVQQLDAFQAEARQRRIVIEFYQWLLLPSILLLGLAILLGTLWKGVRRAPILLGALFFLIPAPRASAENAASAKKALEKGDNTAAGKIYKNLAESALTSELAARYHLGEATAAYRTKNFRDARSAFSGALRTSDPQILSQAHFGIGNSLFQLGWEGLTGEAYPTDETQVPDLDRFDTIVKEKLAKLRSAETPDAGSGESDTYRVLNSLITNWADAIRHFDSAKTDGALKNRRTTYIYLKRLRELMKQEEQQTQQSLPMPGPGQPKEGDEGEEGENGSGPGGNQRGKGDGEEDGPDGKGGDKDDDKDKKGDKGKGDPNETPEERARRILEENSDLEKGPLTPGRRDFRGPEKDW